MQNSRFLILTGHLNDYPLSDLVGILRHQRKTGRLLIEYPKGPACFYFKDGELVDAQLDKLGGLQAVCVAVAQPASSFNFNPLIQPPKRSIEKSLQRVVSELLGCWDENGLEIDAIAPSRPSFPSALPSQAAPQPALLAPAPTTLNISPVAQADQALVFSSVALEVPRSKYSRPVLAMAAAGLLMLGLSTLIALTSFARRSPTIDAASNPPAPVEPERLAAASQSVAIQPAPEVEAAPAKRRDHSAASEPSNRKASSTQNQSAGTNPSVRSDATPHAAASTEKSLDKSTDAAAKTQSVKVILRIENGRVAQASIANPRPGMNAYEALALRIARQRRYPPKAAGPETVMIKVTQAN